MYRQGADTAQTLSRGLRVLELLAAHPDGLRPSDIARALELSRPVVYRLLATLDLHHLLRRTPAGRLAIGLGVLALTVDVIPTLRRILDPILLSLAHDLRATAHFAVADGDYSLGIAVAEPPNSDFHIAYRTGTRYPIDDGALGLAVQAALRGEHRTYHSSGQLTPNVAGVVTSVPLPGVAGAIGVVTFAGTDMDGFDDRVETAAREIVAEYGKPHEDAVESKPV